MTALVALANWPLICEFNLWLNSRLAALATAFSEGESVGVNGAEGTVTIGAEGSDTNWNGDPEGITTTGAEGSETGAKGTVVTT